MSPAGQPSSVLLRRFHTGSLSFGALIIAVIQLIRATLAYIQKKLKGSSGKIAQAILTCMQCCFFILEKVLRYINKQAYIEVRRGERERERNEGESGVGEERERVNVPCVLCTVYR